MQRGLMGFDDGRIRVRMGIGAGCLALIGLLLAWQVQAAELGGAWRGVFQGAPAALQLQSRDGAFIGRMEVSGYPYDIELVGSPEALQGWLSDPKQGGRVPMQAALRGESLQLLLYLQGPGQAPLSVMLGRGDGAGMGAGHGAPVVSSAPASTASSAAGQGGTAGGAVMPGGAIDPALVGTWVHNESYTSGTFSAARQEVVTLTGDGRVIQGAGRVIGGGDAGTFDSGGGQSGQLVGYWSTANRVLYLNEGAGWVPLGGYVVDARNAMIKGASGNKLWSRR